MRLFFAPSWLSRHAPRLLAIIILSLFAAAILWQSLSLRALRDTPLTAINQASSTEPVAIDHQAIAKLLSPTQTNSPQGSSQQVADLTLHGSFVHQAVEKSSALIAKNGAPASRYTLNSQIDEHTWLRAIARDHVILERQGRREHLRFAKSPISTEIEDQEEAAALKRQMLEQLREQMEAASDEALLPVSQTAMDSELP